LRACVYLCGGRRSLPKHCGNIIIIKIIFVFGNLVSKAMTQPVEFASRRKSAFGNQFAYRLEEA